MKKRPLALYLIIFLLCALFGAVYWFMYTATGTSFLLKRIASALPETVKIGNISGTIGDSLSVQDIKVNRQRTNITVRAVDLKWRPLLLIMGELSINSLAIRGVVITRNKPSEDTQYDLLLPRIPGWLVSLQGRADNFSLDDLKYIRPNKELAAVVDSIAAKVLWRRGTLHIDEMSTRTSYGAAEGSLAVNLNRPQLEGQFKIALRKEIAGIDTVSVDARLLPSTGEEQVAGRVTLKTFAGNRERFNVESRIAITRQTVRVSAGRFTEKERKGSIEATGVLDLSGNKPAFALSTKIIGLDIEPETNVATDLSGNLAISGTFEEYNGRFNVKNIGASWRSVELDANIHGDIDHVQIAALKGKCLGGTILGKIQASWGGNTLLSAHLSGKNLNPATAHPDLEGNINMELDARLKKRDDLPIEGVFVAVISDSHFQKREVSGKLDVALHNKTLEVKTLSAKGNGFSITAAGTLEQRLSYSIQIDDASKPFPGTKGSVSAKGWARWRDNEPAGIMNIEGRNISYGGVRASSFRGTIAIPDGYKDKIDFDIAGRNISYNSVHLNLVRLRTYGRLDSHRITLKISNNDDRVDVVAQGNYSDGAWKGTILKVAGKEALFGRYDLKEASNVSVSKKKVFLAPFALITEKGERVEINADIITDRLVGFVDVRWQQVNLTRLNRLAGSASLEGYTSGAFRGQWSGRKDLSISGKLSGSGRVSKGLFKLAVVNMNGELAWNKSGLHMSCDINLEGGGQVNAAVSSQEPAALALPEMGTFQFAWKTIDMNILDPIFPDTLHIKGRLAGDTKGELLPGKRFSLSGKTVLTGGSVTWQSDAGEITAVPKEAALEWTWKDTQLEGYANLALAQHGFLEASFQLPFSATLPLVIDDNGSIVATAKGNLREKGIVSALFPGLVQETGGNIDFALTGRGTFAKPLLDGRLNLSNAAAYLPSAGIRLEGMNAHVLLNNDQVTIPSFFIRSGSGHISGDAVLSLESRRIGTFRGTLKGERFQAVNLPEMQVSINPNLTFDGTTKNLSVNGSMLVPEALFRQQLKDTLIKPSPDVIVITKEAKPRETSPFPVDVTMAVTLGDRVRVNAFGVDTRLTGTVQIAMRDVNDISARGVISTVNGKYDAYGVKLDIAKGHVVFSGGSLDQATLDGLATRKVDDVLAGVRITGTVSAPLVDLYSKPAMPDMDILSYIVLGRPGYGGQSDTALLARAAGALLTSGRSSGLQDKLKRRLGLDTIEIESGSGDISGSIIKIGKYLSPKLYISYGRSIFTGENLFGLRYNVSKRIDLESTVGTKSSVMTYYKIEFD